MSYIDVIHEVKQYDSGGTKLIANNDITFSINQGELVMILGSSGTGKSTLLNVLGGMDSCDKGDVIIDGENIARYNAKELSEYRRREVGFVFQFYNLVPNLTALENVELASEIVEWSSDPMEVLESVGLRDRRNNFPSQLSGGEQQRVAIARAIVKRPKILLCDEPTGALDYQTGKQVLHILQDMSRQLRATVIIVTHNSAIAPMADRVIHMRDAKIENIEENTSPINIDTLEW